MFDVPVAPVVILKAAVEPAAVGISLAVIGGLLALALADAAGSRASPAADISPGTP